MHRLVTSPSAETRLGFAASQLKQLRDHPEVLILTPTKGAGDDFVRIHCLAPSRGGLHRLTLFQLALEIGVLLLAKRGWTPISGVALEAVTARTAHRRNRQAELHYFASVSETVGFTRALGRTLRELRLQRVKPEHLEGVGQSGNDLAILLRLFETELEEARLADPATVYAVATETILSQKTHFADLPLLLVDVLPRNTAESEFLAALAENAPSITAVALPQSERRTERLRRAIGVNSETLEETDTGHTLSLVRRYVFATETPAASPADSTLVFFSATDEGRECVEIARHIQAAVSGGNVRFDDIAILLRNPDTYQPLLEDALERAGIPGHYTAGSIRPNPAGRGFLALLACCSEGLSASRFAEYLSLGQVPMLDEDGSPPAANTDWVPAQGELFPAASLPSPDTPAEDPVQTAVSDNTPVVEGSLRAPFNWERLLVDAAVIGGRDRWDRRLAGFEEELHRQVVEAATDEEARRSYMEKQLVRLKHLKRFALPVIGLLDDLPQAAPWKEWLERLEDLASRTLRQPAHVLSVLGELRPMGEVGPVTLDEVQQVLTDRLSFLRNEPADRRYGKVFVGTIAEAAGRSFGLVFVPGVSEGVFPRKALEDPLLLDESRRGLDTGLMLQNDRVREERLLLHIAAGAARERLFVSYPRMDISQGRARVPSFYALDVLRAGEGRIPNLGELERRATQASMSRLGWPSPNEASKAVDDAEYDLATIGALLHQPRHEIRGRGRYLLEMSPSLARSLRTRARRWRNFWSEADGVVDPDPHTLELLTTHRMENRSYSPTALQQFAACPYRFLLYAIHRLHPREDIATIEQLDPLTRGSLFHTVQYRLLSSLRAEGLLPIDSSNLEAIRSLADDTLNEVAGEYREKLAPAISRIWESEIEELRTDLGGWLRQRSQVDEDWIPRYFEFAFGLDRSQERDPDSRDQEATVLDRVRLRGSIDLIEEHAENGLLRVVDHKTGRVPSRSLVSTGAGEVLQPMLYALAAESLLGKTVASSELSFCTQRGDFSRLEVQVNDESRTDIHRTVQLIGESIRDGFFPAAPRPGACTYCDYRIVCGPYEELRTGRKTNERLDRLQQIRQIP